MASTLGMETVAARRTVGGIDRFTVHLEPAPVARLRLRQPPKPIRAGLCAGAALILGFAAVEVAPWSADARNAEPPAMKVAANNAPVAALGPTPGPIPAWIDVNRPIPLFDLTGSGFGKLPLTYRARRREDASERQDVLLYGTFGTEAPVFVLSILRFGGEPHPSPFFVEVARLAADQSLAVARSGLPTLVQSRFGGFEAADLTVGQGAAARPCLGFRLQAGHDGSAPAPVAMSGLACGTPAKPLDREGLACALDRIDLLSAGEDADLRTFFVEAERKRGQGCTGSHLLAAGSHQTWLDGEAVQPPLKPSGPTIGKVRKRLTSDAAEL